MLLAARSCGYLSIAALVWGILIDREPLMLIISLLLLFAFAMFRAADRMEHQL